jgi:hypothetical protein
MKPDIKSVRAEIWFAHTKVRVSKAPKAKQCKKIIFGSKSYITLILFGRHSCKVGYTLELGAEYRGLNLSGAEKCYLFLNLNLVDR